MISKCLAFGVKIIYYLYTERSLCTVFEDILEKKMTLLMLLIPCFTPINIYYHINGLEVKRADPDLENQVRTRPAVIL